LSAWVENRKKKEGGTGHGIDGTFVESKRGDRHTLLPPTPAASAAQTVRHDSTGNELVLLKKCLFAGEFDLNAPFFLFVNVAYLPQRRSSASSSEKALSNPRRPV
jgi:hypothetical protein